MYSSELIYSVTTLPYDTMSHALFNSHYVLISSSPLKLTSKAEIKKVQTVEKPNAQRPVLNGNLLKASNERTHVGQNRDFLTLESQRALQSYRSAAMNHNRQVSPQVQTFYPRFNKKVTPRINLKPEVKSNRLIARKVSGMFNSKAGLKLGIYFFLLCLSRFVLLRAA